MSVPASTVATRVAKFTDARTPGSLFSADFDPARAGGARHARHVELDAVHRRPCRRSVTAVVIDIVDSTLPSHRLRHLP